MKVMRIRFRRRDDNARAKSFWSSLRADSRGSTLVLVSLAMPVVIGALGLAVDTGLWYLEKRHLQQAADNASLGAVRALQTGATVADARAVAINDARRNGFVSDCDSCFQFNSPPVSGAYAGKTNAVEIVLSRKLPVAFSAYLFSGASMVSARSVGYQSGVQGKNLEVALMLDVSSSMDGAKLEGMQDAAKSVIDIVVQPSQSPFKSRVAIAPYSSSVNVGSDYYQAVTGKTSTKWSTVVERAGTAAFTDDAPASGKYLGEFRTKKSNAMGAYASTVKNYSSNVPATALVHPLTTEKDKLNDTVDSFTAVGTTAGHLGVAWTWYLLSPKWSSIWTGDTTPAAYDASKTLKVAVLLSDFDMNSYYESANGNASVQVQTLCTKMKAAGITVYTVGYNVDSRNTTAVNLWKTYCPSDDKKWYSAKTVDELKAAFRAIAQSAVGGVMTMGPALVE
ncbi:pilus assembly protein TadG-related protein [Vineibacter terrae]|uniref:pilus assembly protein TadG-related protein n=1 Tax=Vineibacter terrae TaxID=2586908 RepID=UPI002E370236|nr:pilus assembly protein TadG-related protein [Vineibacter terrae]HEX2884941.1 pilus assembly protein TadG-related protein [Vineibacter terrae]